MNERVGNCTLSTTRDLATGKRVVDPSHDWDSALA